MVLVPVPSGNTIRFSLKGAVESLAILNLDFVFHPAKLEVLEVFVASSSIQKTLS